MLNEKKSLLKNKRGSQQSEQAVSAFLHALPGDYSHKLSCCSNYQGRREKKGSGKFHTTLNIYLLDLISDLIGKTKKNSVNNKTKSILTFQTE